MLCTPTNIGDFNEITSILWNNRGIFDKNKIERIRI